MAASALVCTILCSRCPKARTTDLLSTHSHMETDAILVDSRALQVRAAATCQLGEGLFWDAVGNRVLWVDILARRLHGLALDSGPDLDLELPQRVGWVLPCRSKGAWLLGLQEGFARLTPGIGAPADRLDWIARPHASPSLLRLNDAKADRSGAVWAGCMNHADSSRPEGVLYRLGPDGDLSVHDTGYHVANGPAISPDQRFMLHTNSALREIYAFDLDVDSGAVANKRLWVRFEDDEGYPDGMCFDAEGCLWVAHWDGARITRRDPRGRVMRRVNLPAPRITNVCFGGAGLDRIFVTSARVGLDGETLARFPDSGALFEVDGLGIRGLPSFGWGGP
jgi:D-xylonolactonase